MVRFCFGCANSSKKKPSVGYFRFPRDEERCALWFQALNRSRLPRHTPTYCYTNLLLCSDHFSPTDIHRRKKRMVLDLNAVPIHNKNKSNGKGKNSKIRKNWSIKVTKKPTDESTGKSRNHNEQSQSINNRVSSVSRDATIEGPGQVHEADSNSTKRRRIRIVIRPVGRQNNKSDSQKHGSAGNNGMDIGVDCISNEEVTASSANIHSVNLRSSKSGDVIDLCKPTDSTKICRLCLKEVSNAKHIFKDYLDNNVPIHLTMIVSLYPIEFSVNDSLPKYACSECLETLSSFVKFKNDVMKNDGIQRERLKKPLCSVSKEALSYQKRNVDPGKRSPLVKRIKITPDQKKLSVDVNDLDPGKKKSMPAILPVTLRLYNKKSKSADQIEDTGTVPEDSVVSNQEIGVDDESSSIAPELESIGLIRVLHKEKTGERKQEGAYESTTVIQESSAMQPEQRSPAKLDVSFGCQNIPPNSGILERTTSGSNHDPSSRIEYSFGSQTTYDYALNSNLERTCMESSQKCYSIVDIPTSSQNASGVTVPNADALEGNYMLSDQQSDPVLFCMTNGYLMEQRLVKGNLRYLQCVLSKCPAVGTQEVLIPGLFENPIVVTKPHNHERLSEVEMKKQKFISLVRTKLQNSKGSSIKSIYDEVCKLDSDLAEILPMKNLMAEFYNL